MKKIFAIIMLLPLLVGCAKLDLNPLSEGSSENWYSNETEVTMALNDLYRQYLWEQEINFETERMTDNWTQRQAVHVFSAGSITSEWAFSEGVWLNTYKGITRANAVINNLPKAVDKIPDARLKELDAEAHFFRAALYSRLIFHYGDVPYYTEYLTIEQAFKLGRRPKAEILKDIYKDFDYAIQYLPTSYGSATLKRATKGAAMAFKARIALYMGDYAVARDAAKACMDLNVYSLYPDFQQYFLSKNKNLNETIFSLPRSFPLGSSWTATNFFPRTAGGSAVAQPSWELFASFPCTDGLPIDESPLYNPRKPFENRDPRCMATIVEFQTAHLGFVYDPNPYATTVLRVSTGKTVSNKDNRAVDQFASYNGLALKKWVDEDWSDDLQTDFDIIIMRYADVLLMYAEAKMELNEIDESVLNAINQVRARAYKVNVTEVGSYPAVTATNQAGLRKLIRNERRIELAWENRRFDDIIRWRIAEKVLTQPIYGLLDPSPLKTEVVDKGLWFFPTVTDIDDEGLPNFAPMYATGKIKLLVERNFDKNRQYLWPIPSKEIIINKNLTQNPNY
ncbi:RagB/SusD family nutrient uptake outer membrane protein [Chitinophaga sp. 30R24]|uniref:RagB/SusD family nutrient uptake outer membrane protein n=1 Tax=Chitinophaga sp. 30R24 TaxID=3248838 RepID=UPI003B908A7F